MWGDCCWLPSHEFPRYRTAIEGLRAYSGCYFTDGKIAGQKRLLHVVGSDPKASLLPFKFKKNLRLPVWSKVWISLLFCITGLKLYVGPSCKTTGLFLFLVKTAVMLIAFSQQHLFIGPPCQRRKCHFMVRGLACKWGGLVTPKPLTIPFLANFSALFPHSGNIYCVPIVCKAFCWVLGLQRINNCSAERFMPRV